MNFSIDAYDWLTFEYLLYLFQISAIKRSQTDSVSRPLKMLFMRFDCMNKESSYEKFSFWIKKFAFEISKSPVPDLKNASESDLILWLIPDSIILCVIQITYMVYSQHVYD